VQFRGYEAGHKPSEISGQPRLYYDRAKPFTRPVKYFNTFKATTTATKPTAYLVPKAWGEVVERLQRNGATLVPLAKDVSVPVEVYYFEDFKTTAKPFEGHYVHSQVQLRTTTETTTFHQGDFVVYITEGAPLRYLMETLEPQATDSFFAWGFFDSVLQQKEHYSDYVFEDLAADLLRRDPALRERLEKLKADNPAFAANGKAQLEWVYQSSPYHEPGHNRYPVARWLGEGKL
jgi:hypothetical protein